MHSTSPMSLNSCRSSSIHATIPSFVSLLRGYVRESTLFGSGLNSFASMNRIHARHGRTLFSCIISRSSSSRRSMQNGFSPTSTRGTRVRLRSFHVIFTLGDSGTSTVSLLGITMLSLCYTRSNCCSPIEQRHSCVIDGSITITPRHSCHDDLESACLLRAANSRFTWSGI